MKKSIYGMYKGAFLVSKAEIYIGEKENGEEFAQFSLLDVGQMHGNFDEIKNISDKEANVILINSGNPYDIPMVLDAGKLKIHMVLSKDLSFDFELEKVSDEARFCEPYSIIPKENVDLLKANNEYSIDGETIDYSYEFSNLDVLAELDKRGFDRAKDDSFSSIWKLFTKMCELFTQDGMSVLDPKNKGTIAKMLEADKYGSCTNCRGMAIIFAGVLRANGIKAFYEGLFSADSNDQECHIVNEVYVEEFGKFVLFDASLCAVYKLDGIYLNSVELKDVLVNGRENDVVVERCNDKKKQSNVEILSYYSKNLVHFMRCINSSESTDMTEDNTVVLSPISAKEEYKKEGIITTDVGKYFGV
jgi:hypothetical protein